jgi:lycopene beta-cyclase
MQSAGGKVHSENGKEVEVVVVGAGPAGAMLADALVARDVETICVAPDFRAWPANYGVWLDEIEGLDIPFEQVWDIVRVQTPRGGPRFFSRPYGKIDGSELASAIFARLDSRGSRVFSEVVSASPSAFFTDLTLSNGSRLRSRVVFDASGHRPALVKRSPTGPAFQTAFGIEMDVESSTMSYDTMCLMDWHDVPVFQGKEHRIPAFLYAMPLSGERWFFEYTVLASRPAVSISILRDGLFKMLESYDVRGQIIEGSEERCFIPMGYSVPYLDQRIVGFGGAASMVHPATGYMVGRCMALVEKIADAVVDTAHLDPDERARQLWRVVWPEERVRAHRLYSFGLEAMLRLSPEQTFDFFDAFFELPQPVWADYLSHRLSPSEIASTMWTLFRHVGSDVQWKLATTALGRHGPHLVRGLFG